MKPEWEAIVVGAGPAGSVAASILAREGRRVAMIGTSRPDFKIGEALPGAAVRLLRAFALPVPRVGGAHRPMRGNASAWTSDRLVLTDFLGSPDGPGWRLDRAEFDGELRRAAAQSGAVVIDAMVEAIRREGGQWRVRLKDGRETAAPWVIDASGRAGVVTKALRVRRSREPRLVALYAQGEAVAVDPGFDRTLVEATSDGWWYGAWLPTRRPVIAVHLESEAATRMLREPERWSRALAQTRHIGKRFAGVRFQGPLRAADAGGACCSQFAGDGWMACGDAALAFDPIASHGLYSAIFSGGECARALLAAERGDEAALADYSARLKKLWEAYALSRRAVYREQSRWSATSFWRKRRRLRGGSARP